ncbi:MAG: DegV family protein [Faecousia sp.]
MTIRLVADSSANPIQDPTLEVRYAPLKMMVGDQEFIDNASLDIDEFLDAMESHRGKTFTTCPSVNDWLDTFQGADTVLGVAITGNLSGSYNSGRVAAEEYENANPGAKVFLMDSLSTGPEMVLILEKYRELAETGASFEEIVEQAKAYVKTTHLVFSLESLENLAKNGRVSPIIAKAAGLLGIRVIGRASQEGTLEPLHKARGEKKALRQIYASMEDLGYRGGKARITHTRNEAAAGQLRDMLLAAFPGADVTVSDNGGLCACYSERGGIMVGFETDSTSAKE